MIVMIIDGQGGGIGAAIIKGLREAGDLNVECWALGTNSIATSRMMKAGANRGATGGPGPIWLCAPCDAAPVRSDDCGGNAYL